MSSAISKGTVITDLNNLAGILKKYRLCLDITPLQNAIGNLAKKKDPKWEYSVDSLILNIATPPRNTVPSNVRSLQAIFSVQIKEFSGTEDVITTSIDNLKFRIVLKGFDENSNVLVAGWHLDFEDGENFDYLHPRFHLTYGGKALEGFQIGSTMLLPAPRIPHPPMDAILGIDFIIRNFISKDAHSQFTSTSEYINIIDRAQRRLWRSYALSFARHWCKFNGCKFKTDDQLTLKLFPMLINQVNKKMS